MTVHSVMFISKTWLKSAVILFSSLTERNQLQFTANNAAISMTLTRPSKHSTSQRGLVLYLWTRSQKIPGSSLRRRTFWITMKFMRVFFLFLQANAIASRPLPRKSFRVHYLRIILQFHAEYSDTLGRDSSVDIHTRYGMDDSGIETRWGRDFQYPSRPALRPT